MTMRFMMIVKHAEKQGPPPKALMDAMAKLAEEANKAGTMLGRGGLGPTALRAPASLTPAKRGSFAFAQDFGGGFPLRSRPLNVGSFAFAQDFGSGLSLRSRPLSASTCADGLKMV